MAALVAMPVMFGIGWLLQSQLFNRTLGPDMLPPLLVTFGLSIVIQNALLEGFSADSRRISAGALETALAGARPDQCRRHAAADVPVGGGASSSG